MKAALIAAADESKVIYRTLHGHAVRFYKRGNSEFYTFDFGRGKERVQRASDYTLIKDAEWQASNAVRKWVDDRSGKTAEVQRQTVARGRVAKVSDVMALTRREGEDRLWEPGTARTYGSALLSLARMVSEDEPESVGLDVLLTSGVIEQFYAAKQGRKSVDWLSKLPENGGANSIVRSVKAIFQSRMVKLFMGHLKLPDLTALREAHYLKTQPTEFQPWDDDVYHAMEAASEGLRTTDPELWLVNAMLRRLGLRDEELLAARREWIEVEYVPAGDGMGPPQRQAILDIKDRPGGEFPFKLLKHGRGRKLPLDAELQEILLPRTGWLIAPHLANAMIPRPGAEYLKEDARWALIYRTHSKWMRQWVGEEAAKTNHQLRKYAGSKVFTEHGLEAAAYFLGDSIATTDNYYRAWLKRGAMLDGKAVARARAA